MSLSLFSGSCVLCKSSIIFRISLSSPLITVRRLFDSSPTLVRTLVFTLRPVSRLFLLSLLFRDCYFCTLTVPSVDPEPSIGTKTAGGGESRWKPSSYCSIESHETLNKPSNMHLQILQNQHVLARLTVGLWLFHVFFLLNRKFHWVHCLLYMIGAPSLASRILNKITWNITLVAGAWSETHEMYHGGFFVVEIGTY